MHAIRAGIIAATIVTALAGPAGSQPVGGQPGAGQPAGTTGAPPAGAQALAQATAAVAATPIWRDAQLLWTTATLRLSPEQRQQLVPLLDQLQAQLDSSRKRRQELWAQSGQAIVTVVTRWIAGAQPDAPTKTLADTLADDAADLTAADEAAVVAAATTLAQVLTPAQNALLETAEEAAQRGQARRRYEGAPSAADYVVRELQSQRALMQDDYVTLRVAEAARVARKLVDPRAPGYRETEAAVLRLFDQVSTWTDDQFATALPGLPDKVRQFLQLEDDAIARPLSYAMVRAWLTDPRTPRYLTVYGTAAPPLPLQDPPPAVELQQALDAAQTVRLLNDWRLSVPQLTQVAACATAARGEVEQAAAAREALLNSVIPQLAPLVPYLISGQPLSEQWDKYLRDLTAKLEEPDRARDVAMVPLVASLNRAFTPEQAATVDWRVPPGIAAEQPAEERARAMRKQAAMIAEAIEMVAFLRPLDLETFNALRPARVERPDSLEYQRVRERVFDEIMQARGISRQDWPRMAPEVATHILQTAGQLREAAAAPTDRKPLDWSAISSLLRASQTEQLVQQMIAARSRR